MQSPKEEMYSNIVSIFFVQIVLPFIVIIIIFLVLAGTLITVDTVQFAST